MRFLIGLVFITLGALVFKGNRHASYVFAPDAWLWHNIFGIQPGPLYRKTGGVALIVTGLSFFVLGPIVSIIF